MNITASLNYKMGRRFVFISKTVFSPVMMVVVNTVLLIGRVLVESDSDLETAYGLEKQKPLTPLGSWQPGK